MSCWFVGSSGGSIQNECGLSSRVSLPAATGALAVVTAMAAVVVVVAASIMVVGPGMVVSVMFVKKQR